MTYLYFYRILLQLIVQPKYFDYLAAYVDLNLNLGKTKAIWLGSWRHMDNKPLGLNWTNELVRTLGIYISYNKQENNKENVVKKIDNLTIKLDIYGEAVNSPFRQVPYCKKPGNFTNSFFGIYAGH